MLIQAGTQGLFSFANIAGRTSLRSTKLENFSLGILYLTLPSLDLNEPMGLNVVEMLRDLRAFLILSATPATYGILASAFSGRSPLPPVPGFFP